jgi:arylsulfatase A-like enzyme
MTIQINNSSLFIKVPTQAMTVIANINIICMKKLLMKKFLIVMFVLTLLLGCKNKIIKPNIILIMTDDQGYGDISAHGSPDVLTPNMDKLKSQGISMEDFQVSPTSAPTRSAILTGRHPFKNGITHTILERERMALGVSTLPEVLKRGGYTSGIFGKWHLGDEHEYQPDSRGFDEVFIHGAGGIGQAYAGSCADVPDNKYFDPTIKHNGTFVKTKGYCTDIFFTQALSWIKTKANDKKPFFAYIATNAPHGPFIAPEKYKEKFIKQNYPENAQGFYGMIENVDDNLGLLMEKLNTWDLADNTILIFMSDNGKTWGGQNNVHGETYNAGMKGFKGSVNEGGTRVPFFIRWPNEFNAGEKVDALLNHFDILPTLADIAGIDISDIPDMDGQSFLPYLRDNAYKSNDRYRFFHGGRWPLNPENTDNQEGSERWVGTIETSNPDNSIYKNCAVRNERYRFVNNKELYDVISDPGETQDIASEHQEVVVQMRIAYDEWWSKVRPYMVNENVPLLKEKPFWEEYKKQKESGGIKDWIIPSLD